VSSVVSINLILAATRSTLLILCALAGILCIFLGWKLYVRAITTPTAGELSGLGFRLKLASGGPGVFMCALGVWLLLSVVNRPFQTTEQTAVPSASSAGFLMVAQAASPPEPRQTKCLLRITSTTFDTGESDLTAATIGEAADTAVQGLLRAGAAGIKDDEQRVITVTSLNRLAFVAAKNRDANLK
jgi:hypothetical protein